MNELRMGCKLWIRYFDKPHKGLLQNLFRVYQQTARGFGQHRGSNLLGMRLKLRGERTQPRLDMQDDPWRVIAASEITDHGTEGQNDNTFLAPFIHVTNQQHGTMLRHPRQWGNLGAKINITQI